MVSVPLALFDLDNTLIDRVAAYRRWAEGFVAARGLAPGAVDWLCERDEDGLASRYDLFIRACEHFDLDESAADLVTDYRREYPRVFEPDADITAALTRLRGARWRIAVVTNGPIGQHDKLARAGLADLVDACCVSDEVGVAKPDPRIFLEAIERAGGRPPPDEPAWMVGDAAVPDIGGGRGVGLLTAWIHRDRPWDRSDFRPDVIVATVPEAVTVLLHE